MKRKNASASANEKLGKAKIEELGYCSSYADLPSDIITKIMLALPIESILICKCVCKNWKAVISDSHFAKLHHERAHVRYMFRTVEYDKLVSRTLYLLPQISEIECKNHLKLKPRFKLPLRNGKSILDKYEVLEKSPILAAAAKLRLDDKKAAAKSISDKYKSKRPIAAAAANKIVLKKSPYIACNPNYMKFEIVNSSNGLLCLASPSPEGGFGPPIVICNPVTGEFITLPKPQYNKGWTHVLFGFGFEPKTNEYKVIKMSRTANVNQLESSLLIEIYTLGTPTWRNVEVDPKAKAGKLALRLGFNWKHEFPINWKHEFPTYLNGALHWIRFIGSKMFILCFNFESERLQSFPSPPDENNENNENNQIYGMGEVNGLLCFCYTSGVSNATMWVMKKYGDGESWTKAYSIDTLSKPSVVPNPWYFLCFPVKHPEEGAAAMLFYHPNQDCFTYYVPERFGLKVFRLVGTQPERVEVIPHIPSLVSLKDIVKVDNIEVLNIHSRCAKLKLEEENEVLSLVPKIDDVIAW